MVTMAVGSAVDSVEKELWVFEYLEEKVSIKTVSMEKISLEAKMDNYLGRYSGGYGGLFDGYGGYGGSNGVYRFGNGGYGGRR